MGRKILDTPKVIQQCLNCDKPECTNCIGQVKEIRRREQMRNYNANLTPDKAERQRESKIKYRNSPHGKAKQKEYSRIYYLEHKEEAKQRVYRNRLKKRMEKIKEVANV